LGLSFGNRIRGRLPFKESSDGDLDVPFGSLEEWNGGKRILVRDRCVGL
jgi:hypothetical protein